MLTPFESSWTTVILKSSQTNLRARYLGPSNTRLLFQCGRKFPTCLPTDVEECLFAVLTFLEHGLADRGFCMKRQLQYPA